MTCKLRATWIAFALTVIVLAAGPASAQSIKIPTLEHGQELARLEPFVGRWTGGLTRFLPNGKTLELAPTLEAVWNLGDAWLEIRDQTELPDGTLIHNRTWLTWSAREGRYAGAWQDNVLPGFVTFEGRWLDDGRLELDTGEFELFGRPHRVVFTYRAVSNDEFVIEMRQSWDRAEPRRVAEGRFSRVTT